MQEASPPLKIQAPFCYPTHFLSIFRLRVHPHSPKPFSAIFASGKLIQSPHKDSKTSIVRLIVEQWTPIPLLPLALYNIWLFCKESFCCLRGEVMFSWKCTGCEVAAPGYIKGKQTAGEQHHHGFQSKRDPEIIQGGGNNYSCGAWKVFFHCLQSVRASRTQTDT